MRLECAFHLLVMVGNACTLETELGSLQNALQAYVLSDDRMLT